jgi:mono/diheme cytochrome c family protein
MRPLLLLVLTLTAPYSGGVAAPAEAVDFNRDVRPLLAENCFQCHGPDAAARQAGLRLDLRDEALRARDGNAAIVPGDVTASELFRRIATVDPALRMPPPETDKVLSAEAIETLKRWIQEDATYARHWSLEPIRRPTTPVVRDAPWTRVGLDRFVLARLEKEGLSPAPEADRTTLARRLSLDLLGLPPSPETMERFLADRSPDAYGKLVERLLSNPHFGERWGRHWLDQARYADSNGYTNDNARSMWPYRDWVIQAFNSDLPFDQFTIEQLAGDLLPEPTLEQRIATGFHRNTLINTEGGTKPDQFRVEQTKDRVDTTGLVWLGLTVGCAKCHTHKYDPIEQREYYQLYAFFNSTEDENSTEPMIVFPDAKQQLQLDEFELELATLKTRLSTLSGSEKQAAEGQLKTVEDNQRNFRKSLPSTMVLKELTKPRPTHVQIRGDFLRPAEEVEAGVPAVLPSLKVSAPPRGSRLDLAQWLVAEENPLTARVRVNRIWMRLFGRGLVETENDFGTQGSLPSHPKLLDWLASEFVDADWSTKRFLQTIVRSATYRQSSRLPPPKDGHANLGEIDPQGKLLARQMRLRVEAEIVRDLGLAVSGLLETNIGGPSVYPLQPGGVYAFTQRQIVWKVSPGGDRYRRGMYTFFYRSAPHPMLTTFDVPRFNETCTQRERSNTPLQSLTLANDDALFEVAQALASRVLTESGQDASTDMHRLDRMFRLCLARPPRKSEAVELLDFLVRQRGRLSARVDDAKRLRPGSLPEEVPPAEGGAWTAVARVLLNLDEFVTRE